LVEVYALWCGLALTKEEGISKLLVIGDLLLEIQTINGQGSNSSNKINSILKNIKHLSQSLEQIHFFHVKRGLNAEDNSWGKKSKSIQQGSLCKNGVLHHLEIP